MVLVVCFYAAWIIGHRVGKRVVDFANPSGWRRFVAGSVGVLVLVTLAMCLRHGLPIISLPGSLSEAVAGFVIGGSTSLLIPWILVKLGLLHRSKS